MEQSAPSGNKRPFAWPLTFRSAFWLIVLVNSIVVVAIHAHYMRPWNPVLSHDTRAYFYPSQEALNAPSGLVDGVVASFGIPRYILGDPDTPNAAQAKPVFVIMLLLWGELYRGITGPQTFPNHQAYSDWIIASVWLMFLSLAGLGFYTQHPWIGLITANIMSLSTWALTAIYFNSYTAISIALFSIVLLLGYKPSAARLWAAGAICALLLLINQSYAVLIAGFALMLLVQIPLLRLTPPKLALKLARAPARRTPLLRPAYFVLGLASVFVVAWVLSLAVSAHTGIRWLSPVETLFHYLARSGGERTEHFAAYDGSLFFTVLSHYSLVVTGAAAAILAVLLCTRPAAGIAKPGQFSAIGLFAIPALAAMFLIDIRYGPKFSRSYVLLYPLLLMSALILVKYLVDANRKWIAAVSVVAALFVAESVQGFRDFHAAFLGAPEYLKSGLREGQKIAVLKNDTYSLFLQRWVSYFNQGAVVTLSDTGDLSLAENKSVVFVLTGPHVKNVLEGTHEQPRQFPIVDDRAAAVHGIALVRRKLFPFFGGYPLLILEDPAETYRLVVSGETKADDYRNGPGRVTLWQVVRPARQDARGGG